MISSANLKKVNTTQLASSMNAASLTLKIVNIQRQLLANSANADHTSATITVKIVVNKVASKNPPTLML